MSMKHAVAFTLDGMEPEDKKQQTGVRSSRQHTAERWQQILTANIWYRYK
jgi:hypothetical protein